MTYYVFNPIFKKKPKTFFKVKAKSDAEWFRDKGYTVYRKEPGVPNPWYVRRLLVNGTFGKLKVI